MSSQQPLTLPSFRGPSAEQNLEAMKAELQTLRMMINAILGQQGQAQFKSAPRIVKENMNPADNEVVTKAWVDANYVHK